MINPEKTISSDPEEAKPLSEFEEWQSVVRQTSVMVREKCPDLTEAEVREASHKIIRRQIEQRKEER